MSTNLLRLSIWIRGRLRQTKIDSNPHNMSYSSQQVDNKDIFARSLFPPVAVWRIKRKHSRIFEAEQKVGHS